VRSISWHESHHVAEIDSSTGFRSARARANAALPHGCQATPFERTLKEGI
jgi:hypothetical protein